MVARPERIAVNVKDLADISDDVKNALDIIPAAHMDDVLAQALVRKPEAIEWDEEAAARAALAAAKADAVPGAVTAH